MVVDGVQHGRGDEAHPLLGEKVAKELGQQFLRCDVASEVDGKAVVAAAVGTGKLMGLVNRIRTTYYPLISASMPTLIDLQARLLPIEMKMKA